MNMKKMLNACHPRAIGNLSVKCSRKDLLCRCVAVSLSRCVAASLRTRTVLFPDCVINNVASGFIPDIVAGKKIRRTIWTNLQAIV